MDKTKTKIKHKENIMASTNGVNGWWGLIVGILMGALAPTLLAWGSMSAKIENNTELVKTKVRIVTIQEYKEGNTKLLESMVETLKRIESNQKK